MEREGKLPTLTALRRQGELIDFDTSPLDLFPSATYPSLYTGTDVREHGIYSAFPWSATQQRFRYMHATTRPPAVWERLTPSRRSLVIDPYDMWRPAAMTGACINGWQYPNRIAALERWSVPASLHRSLSRTLGRAPLVEDSYGAQPARRLLALRPKLIDAPSRVAAAVELMLRRERYDLLWVSFSAAHFAGHFLWNTSQVEGGDAETRRLLETTIDEVYE